MPPAEPGSAPGPRAALPAGPPGGCPRPAGQAVSQRTDPMRARYPITERRPYNGNTNPCCGRDPFRRRRCRLVMEGAVSDGDTPQPVSGCRQASPWPRFPRSLWDAVSLAKSGAGREMVPLTGDGEPCLTINDSRSQRRVLTTLVTTLANERKRAYTNVRSNGPETQKPRSFPRHSRFDDALSTVVLLYESCALPLS